jgi:2-polyprenyl-6-methoxyphenol hydroxylase-like FAD-dependent oxidoreductase
MSFENSALIVGAGIGGLAAAISLRQAGWDVRVFERAASPRELGFALLLAPNAMHALGALGLAEAARRGGWVATDGQMRRPDGTVLRRFNTATARALLDEDTVCILRTVLHGALLDAVGRDAISAAREVTGFTSSGEGVELTIANGTTASGRILIAADGVGSLIRRRLHPAEGAPRRSGLLAIRGVARDAVQHLGHASGAQYFGRGLEAGVARAGEREVYWYLSLRADLLARQRAGEGTAVGSGTAAEIAERCTSEFHEPFRAIVRATSTDDLRLDALFDREPMDDWGAGPVTLLGDAAHPMLPHAGQGAAQALEDAVALGQVLDAAGDNGAPEAALRRYERVRSARTRVVVKLARSNARVGSLKSGLGCWIRDLGIRFVPESVILKQLVALGRPPAP